jgi:hypothetical protein
MSDNGNRQNQLKDTDLQDVIISALEDPRYDWRTVEGVAEQTSVPGPKVQEILKSLERDVVRSAIPDELGRALYTTRKHYRETHGLGARFLSALSDKVA